jgi:hypothetical protein
MLYRECQKTLGTLEILSRSRKPLIKGFGASPKQALFHSIGLGWRRQM